jgi:hypothetical protein
MPVSYHEDADSLSQAAVDRVPELLREGAGRRSSATATPMRFVDVTTVAVAIVFYARP